MTSATTSTEPVRARVQGAGAERLGLPDALARVTCLIRADEHEEAQRLLDAILTHWPQQPDALHFLGVLRHAQGDSAAAVSLIRRAAALQPEAPGPWLNLGNVFAEGGRIDDAIAAYDDSLQRDPNSSLALNNLGIMYRRKGNWRDAEMLCRRAVALDPAYADGWYNLSLILVHQGRVAEGIQANSKAVALWPRDLQARDAVIRALIMLGETEQAAQMYRDWLAEEPGNPVILHNLAACLPASTRDGTPPRASDAYVEQVFDSFAPTFDVKLANLDYRAPALVAAALGRVLPAPQRQFDVADVGCGTGLVGPLVRDWARRLAGCDLSVGMLRRARSRAVYDVLHKAELVNYLDTQTGAFDVVVSADTLCYFGDLTEVARAAHGALRPGGTLVFTVEALDEAASESFRLQLNGRYAHSRAHLESVLPHAMLPLVEISSQALRLEAGAEVTGWLVVARRPMGADSDLHE